MENTSPDLNLGHTRLIRDAATSAGLSIQQTVCVLAAAYWETARTMLPVKEVNYVGAADSPVFKQRARCPASQIFPGDRGKEGKQGIARPWRLQGGRATSD